VALAFVLDLEALEIDARESRRACLQLFGREVQLVGRQHRAFDVVPPFLVSLGDAAARAIHAPAGSAPAQTTVSFGR
jgi:hypothetical protein